MKKTTLIITVLGAFALVPQVLRADEANIYGEIVGLGCQGANSKLFSGFAAAAFSFATSTASGLSANTSFADVVIVKGLDDCTPLLFGAAAKGTHFSKVNIRVVTTKGKEATVELLVTLDTVSIKSDKFTEGAADELDEEIALDYRRITITHVPSGKTFTFDRQTQAN